jgi:thioredoxin-related protein
MKQTSFSDSSLMNFLNENFYLIDFDAESSDTIIYKDKEFFNPKQQGMPFNQLALLLGNNSITFPSLVILDENMTVIDNIPSYIPPEFLTDIIHFYGEDIYKKKNWAEYMKDKSAKGNN